METYVVETAGAFTGTKAWFGSGSSEAEIEVDRAMSR